jgi:hypothetical protein
MNLDSKTQSCGKTLILLLETKVGVEISQQGSIFKKSLSKSS